MTQDEFNVYSCIKNQPDHFLDRLAKQLHLDDRKLGRIVKALEARGLIENVTDDDDEWAQYRAIPWTEIDEHEQKANAIRHICEQFRTYGKRKFVPEDLVAAFHNELDIWYIIHTIFGGLIIDRVVTGPPHKGEYYITVSDRTCAANESADPSRVYFERATAQQVISGVVQGPVIQGDVIISDSSKTKTISSARQGKDAGTRINIKEVIGYLIGAISVIGSAIAIYQFFW